MKQDFQPPTAVMHSMSAAEFRICTRLETLWRLADRTETLLADQYVDPHPGLSLAESCSAMKPCAALSHLPCPRHGKTIAGFGDGRGNFIAYCFTEMSNFVFSSSSWRVSQTNVRDSQWMLLTTLVGLQLHCIKLKYVATKLRFVNDFPSASDSSCRRITCQKLQQIISNFHSL
jgi:hypothetical protein